MELYFDKNGLISNVVNPTFNSTSDKAERITAIAAFDTSDFITNITFKRADGLILGPFKMNRTEEGFDYLDIYQPITMISGPLEMTIRYEVIVSGVVLQSKVVAKAVAFVNPSVEKGNDILAAIYERVKDGIYFEDGEDGKSAYEIAVEHGFVGTEEEWLNTIYEPVYKVANDLEKMKEEQNKMSNIISNQLDKCSALTNIEILEILNK